MHSRLIPNVPRRPAVHAPHPPRFYSPLRVTSSSLLPSACMVGMTSSSFAIVTAARASASSANGRVRQMDMRDVAEG